MKCVKYHLTNESIRYNAIQYLRTCDLDIIV
ncbi:recombination protein NinB, partial [Salmonella enterica subsp. enterica]|nr:recombination protein NinB [Salmonella enterica subsp. enterica]